MTDELSTPVEPQGDAPPVEPSAVFTTLVQVTATLPPERIDEVWIFPPRKAGGTESAVVVLAVLSDDDPRRRLFTAHYIASRDRRGRLQVSHSLVEHGAAAPERIARVVSGVVRRLDDAALAAPHGEPIHGDPDRWHELLASLRSPTPVARGGAPGYQ
jgi:hypothetical protein